MLYKCICIYTYKKESIVVMIRNNLRSEKTKIIEGKIINIIKKKTKMKKNLKNYIFVDGNDNKDNVLIKENYSTY